MPNPYEALYAPVPDVDLYLKRIGCEKESVLSREYLDRLVWGHLSHVPFENLDVCEKGMIPSLNTEDLFNKIVVRRRGGYCFEQNGLFQKFLCGLGFDAYCVAVRIMGRSDGWLPPVRHRGVVVNIGDERFYCDVGFGGACPVSAVKIDDGKEWQQSGSRQYKGYVSGKDIHIDMLDGGVESHLFFFRDEPTDEIDFTAPNCAVSADPESHFRTARIVSVLKDNGSGYVSLNGNIFKEKTGDVITEKELSSDKEFFDHAEKYFGIVL